MASTVVVSNARGIGPGIWHEAADLGCPLSRRVFDLKQACQPAKIKRDQRDDFRRDLLHKLRTPNPLSGSSEAAGPNRQLLLILRFRTTGACRVLFGPTRREPFHTERLDCGTMNDLPIG